MTRYELNEIRKKKGLSFEYMESQTNVAAGTYKNFFYNKTGSPRGDTADAIAKMLGVPVADVICSDVEDIKETIEEMEKPDAISIIALKKIYEFQMEAKDAMHAREKEEIRRHYTMHIEEIKEQYEKHIETLILDKKWFRLAAVFGVGAVIALFFFVEFMTPSHGWFRLGDNHGALTYIAGAVAAIELVAIMLMLAKGKKKSK